MAFDWNEYLTLAAKLLQSPEEAAKRSAISRAYYAAYHAARERLLAEGESLPAEGDSHKLVWNLFQHAPVTGSDIRYYIGLDGNTLRKIRNAADYDDVFLDLAARAEKAVKRAEQIIADLNRLPAS